MPKDQSIQYKESETKIFRVTSKLKQHNNEEEYLLQKEMYLFEKHAKKVIRTQTSENHL